MVSVSFTHDMLDEPKVQVEVPTPNRKVILSVCEQNRASDWKRFVKEASTPILYLLLFPHTLSGPS
jgi:hypothetical protein